MQLCEKISALRFIVRTQNITCEIRFISSRCFQQPRKMPIVEINGVLVKFPYEEPYQVQRNYMHTVIESLERSGNAILESPTGN